VGTQIVVISSKGNQGAQLNKNDGIGDIQMVGAICIKLCVAMSYACSHVVSKHASAAQPYQGS
jgi:hypothetical protein